MRADWNIPGAYWVGLLAALVMGGTVFAQREPAYPEWWYNQGLISGTAYNDFAAANQGEAKNFAVGAVNELDVDLAPFRRFRPGRVGPLLDRHLPADE